MRRATALLIALIVGLTGCAQPAETDETGAPVPDAELLAKGADLYAQSCASCHGADLRGTDRGPSHLSEIYRPSHHADGSFLLAVRRGVPQHHWLFGPMPPVEGLTDGDVEAIVAFVRDAQGREGYEEYPP